MDFEIGKTYFVEISHVHLDDIIEVIDMANNHCPEFADFPDGHADLKIVGESPHYFMVEFDKSFENGFFQSLFCGKTTRKYCKFAMLKLEFEARYQNAILYDEKRKLKS